MGQSWGPSPITLSRTYHFKENKLTAFAVIQIFLFINVFGLKASSEKAEMMILDFTANNRFKGDEGAKEIGKILCEKVEKICE